MLKLMVTLWLYNLFTNLEFIYLFEFIYSLQLDSTELQS